jgi:hypothetical protein
VSGRRRTLLVLGLSAPVLIGVGFAGGAFASPAGVLSPVPSAQPKAVGVNSPNVLAAGLQEVARAEGAMPVENPTADVPAFGFNGNGTFLPTLAGDPPSLAEASKTEPDKNTYLVLKGQTGADAGYNYGTHFVFQGHETGVTGQITRVNLDADAAHRVTLLATKDSAGKTLPIFDGSTWDPFAGKLLFTAELGANGGVWQADAGFSATSTAADISGAFGRAGYEGVQTDKDGNIWLVEDTGGTTINGAKLPNSFVFRFIPANKNDLTHGKLQVLQVTSLRDGQPITFSTDPEQAIFGDNIRDLHTVGKKFKTQWVTLHDTAVDGTTPFDANAAAKTAGGTPFKRPENGVFRPGLGFREFYFSETGDTSATSPANDSSRTTVANPDNAFGGLGGIMRLRQDGPSSNSGTLSLAVNGDIDHTSFDNVTFWDKDNLAVAEDRGDLLHSQHNALDSSFLFDVSDPQPKGVRWLAEGRDPAATIDSALLGRPGFQNEGDNEVTGIHVSNGDPSKAGLFGALPPSPFKNGWRVFWTQQHGNNVLWEVQKG